jgi:hypothetical protein
MDGALRGMAPPDPEAFVQGVADCLVAGRDAPRFVEGVERALGFRRRTFGKTRGAIAAGLLAGFAALAFVAARPRGAVEAPGPTAPDVAEEMAPPAGPVDELTLLPAHGRIVGTDWQRVKDEEASSGLALQSSGSATPEAKAPPARPASYVHFSFFAEADKEYAIRIQARGRVDSAIVLEPRDAALVSSCFTVGPAEAPAFTFDGAGLPASYAWVEEGYWWVGRNGPGSLDRIPDLTRAVVRFARPGRQSMKLYVKGGPVRVEAIHLSTPYRAGL